MKKHINEFLQSIEKESGIKMDFLSLGPTEKMFNRNNAPINVDRIVMNDKMTFQIFSCGCGHCKDIALIQIFYGSSSDLDDAKETMMLIKKVAPNVKIELVDEFEFLRIS